MASAIYEVVYIERMPRYYPENLLNGGCRNPIGVYVAATRSEIYGSKPYIFYEQLKRTVAPEFIFLQRIA